MEFHPSKNVKTPIIITYSKIRQLSHGKKTNGNLQNGQIRTALDTPYISGKYLYIKTINNKNIFKIPIIQ